MEREVSRGSYFEGDSEEKICLRKKKRKKKETDGCGIYHHSHLLVAMKLGFSEGSVSWAGLLPLGLSSSGLLIPL